MSLTLGELRLKNCSKFMETLCLLEDALNTENFKGSLETLHRSFLVLCNSFEISTKKVDIITEATENKFGIKKVSIASLTLLLYNNIVIDLEGQHTELSYLFVGKTAEEATSKAKLYYDYSTRCCDFCGIYFLRPEFASPTARLQMDDFILVYHPLCYKEN